VRVLAVSYEYFAPTRPSANAATDGLVPSGSWDSIHVFETLERGRQAHYKLTSTVMLQLVTRKGTELETKTVATEKKGPDGLKREGEVSLSGSMTRQVRTTVAVGTMNVANDVLQAEQDWPIQDSTSHIGNIGRMIEDMEIKMRNLLQEVCLVELFMASPLTGPRSTLARHATLCTICEASTISRRHGDNASCRRSW